MSNKETAKELFDAGQENGDSRDLIIVEMVKAGVSLNTAQNLYKEFAAEAGISTPRVGYKAEALAILEEEQPELETVEQRAEVRDMLKDKFGVAQSTANDYIKWYAEKAGIELPRSSFGSSPEDQQKIFDWIVENPNCEKAEFSEFMKSEMNRSSGSIDETYRGLVLARKLQAAGVEFEA